MKLEYIEKVIKLIKEYDIDEVELFEYGKKLKLKNSKKNKNYQKDNFIVNNLENEKNSNQIEIKSPFIGTFHFHHSKNLIEIGTQISKGDVLCVIEAMKLMNEIISEHSGMIKKILVKDGDPVEYDQVLFILE